jgi:DNA-binding response OmpR family regulator
MLVVDDEKVITFAFETYFGQQGFAVDTASSRDEAIGLLNRNDYDVLIADLRLTGTDGVEGMEIVQHARERSSRMAIVMLTAYRSAAEADPLGADVLLQKPKRLAEVAQVVEDLLRRHRTVIDE